MQIDTGGRNLSQGQRQLVGLARAILRRSPIIILDEVSRCVCIDVHGIDDLFYAYISKTERMFRMFRMLN